MAKGMFRDKAGYRQRRWQDGALCAPLGIGLLWGLPLGWEAPSTAHVLGYIFAVWAGLVILALVFARALAREAAR